MPSRVIREGLIDSETVAALHDRTFRFYVHLLLAADDYGLVATDYGPIKRAAPLADWSRELVGKMLTELIDAELILPYEAEGKRFAAIARWRSAVNSVKPKYPVPPFGMTHALKPYKFKSADVAKEASRFLGHISDLTEKRDTPATPQCNAGSAPAPLRGKGEEVKGKIEKTVSAPAKPARPTPSRDWEPPEKVRQWYREKGYPPECFAQHVDFYQDYRRNAKKLASDADAQFRNAVRAVWGDIRRQFLSGRTRPQENPFG